jgi:hypothetical protein
MEVLGASFVIVIALVGVGLAMTQAAKKSSAPHKVEMASMLAAERLAYFRSQLDPFRAAGGTHYIFTTNSAGGDLNNTPAANNNYNAGVLFVREYLHSADEGQQINTLTGIDDGKANQRLRTFRGAAAGDLAINQVPPTRSGVDRVAQSVDGATAAPAAPAGVVTIAAPRANANLPGGTGTPIPPTIKFIREVWVQTNHLIHTGNGGIVTPALVVRPDAAVNLPPYTVAVTVKVFARDPKTRAYIQAPAASTVPYRDGQWRGPGYDPTKPLAVMTGFFGLRRNMN